MKSRSHSSALLVELLIVIAFFMLAAAFLVQMFSAARMQGNRADLLSRALAGGQNVAEQLYAAEDPQMRLKDLGFLLENQEDGKWILEQADYRVEVTLQEEEQASGKLLRQQVRIVGPAGVLVDLPVAHYQEAER